METTARLLTGETLLSLYPIMVKLIPVGLLSLVQNRLLATALVSYFFMSLPVSHFVRDIRYHLVSSLYLFHIYASYVGFRNLDVGVSLTLFYTYPLLNLLFKSGTNWAQVGPYFLLCLLGVGVISYGASGNVSGNAGGNAGGNVSGSLLVGLVAIFISALSESGIYTFYRREVGMNTFDMLFSLSFTGLLISLIFGINIGTSLWDRSNILFIALINILLGVVGYALRFSVIQELSVEWYSVLAFTQVIMAYVLGWLIMGESVTLPKIAGSGLILYSVAAIRQMGYR